MEPLLGLRLPQSHAEAQLFLNRALDNLQAMDGVRAYSENRELLETSLQYLLALYRWLGEQNEPLENDEQQLGWKYHGLRRLLISILEGGRSWWTQINYDVFCCPEVIDVDSVSSPKEQERLRLEIDLEEFLQGVNGVSIPLVIFNLLRSAGMKTALDLRCCFAERLGSIPGMGFKRLNRLYDVLVSLQISIPPRAELLEILPNAKGLPKVPLSTLQCNSRSRQCLREMGIVTIQDLALVPVEHYTQRRGGVKNLAQSLLTTLYSVELPVIADFLK